MQNYLRLLDKIDRFAAELIRRRPEAFACCPGCADCCVAGITVWHVEFDHVQSRLASRKGALTSLAGRCPHLDANLRCTIYDARPVVCRLWGLPQLLDGKLSCCGRNFQGETTLEALPPSDIVDMEVILSTLAAINHVYCAKHSLDPALRLPLAP